MKKWLLSLLIALLLAGATLAETRWFFETWEDIRYCESNVEQKGFSSIIGYYQGKLGVYLFDTPVQVYGALYGVASQNSAYWNNSVAAGPAIRVFPLQGFKSEQWYLDWVPSTRIFCESLNISYQKNAASGEANKTSDLRTGIEVYHEWNLDKPDLNEYWGEVWLNLSYRTTNFSWTDFNNYILYFQPRIGRHLGRGIEPYLKLDLTYSGKSDYWLNVATYGAGIRFEPWRLDERAPEILREFKMFAEILGNSYLWDKPTNPNQNVTSDARFGIDFSMGR
ncbi:MAG: hypothetical protein PHH14_06635 [Candidatus Margulisbacteria bacterium]|nr:hypothetical protein [Candidatus Margulisiibacteriota bacterium]